MSGIWRCVRVKLAYVGGQVDSGGRKEEKWRTWMRNMKNRERLRGWKGGGGSKRQTIKRKGSHRAKDTCRRSLEEVEVWWSCWCPIRSIDGSLSPMLWPVPQLCPWMATASTFQRKVPQILWYLWWGSKEGDGEKRDFTKAQRLVREPRCRMREMDKERLMFVTSERLMFKAARQPRHFGLRHGIPWGLLFTLGYS